LCTWWHFTSPMQPHQKSHCMLTLTSWRSTIVTFWTDNITIFFIHINGDYVGFSTNFMFRAHEALYRAYITFPFQLHISYNIIVIKLQYNAYVFYTYYVFCDGLAIAEFKLTSQAGLTHQKFFGPLFFFFFFNKSIVSCVVILYRWMWVCACVR
jgi:hypothetical protein